MKRISRTLSKLIRRDSPREKDASPDQPAVTTETPVEATAVDSVLTDIPAIAPTNVLDSAASTKELHGQPIVEIAAGDDVAFSMTVRDATPADLIKDLDKILLRVERSIGIAPGSGSGGEVDWHLPLLTKQLDLLHARQESLHQQLMRVGSAAGDIEKRGIVKPSETRLPKTGQQAAPTTPARMPASELVESPETAV
ncbi:hypothetical protein BC832DRAFT_540173 [Gaertneriomyces semiglobifer]|nr:hypothetical protein BC832DRAFT_540173 [Gaertneriomyces semiglobifer]